MYLTRGITALISSPHPRLPRPVAPGARRSDEPNARRGSQQSGSLTVLSFLCFSQNNPDRLFEPLRHSLQRRQPQVPSAALEETVLRAVHPDVVGERLLAEPGSLPMTTDYLRKTHLQRGAGALHHCNLAVACFQNYTQNRRLLILAPTYSYLPGRGWARRPGDCGTTPQVDPRTASPGGVRQHRRCAARPASGFPEAGRGARRPTSRPRSGRATDERDARDQFLPAQHPPAVA